MSPVGKAAKNRRRVLQPLFLFKKQLVRLRRCRAVGTEKMRLIFNDYYSKQSYSSPEKLLLLMLLCDLKVPGWAAKLQGYIKNTSKKDFLWVIFFKCQYCLQFNYFGAETPKIIGPMAECYIKVNSLNKLAKSKIIVELSQKTRLLDNKKEQSKKA